MAAFFGNWTPGCSWWYNSLLLILACMQFARLAQLGICYSMFLCNSPPLLLLFGYWITLSDFNNFEQEILIWKALLCNYGNTANLVTNCLNCNQGFQIPWYVDHWPLWWPTGQIKPFHEIPLFWYQKTLTFPHYLCPWQIYPLDQCSLNPKDLKQGLISSHLHSNWKDM